MAGPQKQTYCSKLCSHHVYTLTVWRAPSWTVRQHPYADGTHICGFCQPVSVLSSKVQNHVSDCICDVGRRMRSNWQDWDDLMHFPRRQHQISPTPLAFKLCSMMHSTHARKSPVYFANLVQGSAVNQCRWALRSGDSTKYRMSRCRSALGERAFSFAGPLTWNKLPSALRVITDQKQFRKCLKTNLFSFIIIIIIF